MLAHSVQMRAIFYKSNWHTEANAHGKNVHSNHHNGQQSGVVGSLGAIVEENKTVKEDDGKNEIVLDENGNPIPQQRHRPRVIVEVQGERGK